MSVLVELFYFNELSWDEDFQKVLIAAGMYSLIVFVVLERVIAQPYLNLYANFLYVIKYSR